MQGKLVTVFGGGGFLGRYVAQALLNLRIHLVGGRHYRFGKPSGGIRGSFGACKYGTVLGHLLSGQGVRHGHSGSFTQRGIGGRIGPWGLRGGAGTGRQHELVGASNILSSRRFIGFSKQGHTVGGADTVGPGFDQGQRRGPCADAPSRFNTHGVG